MIKVVSFQSILQITMLTTVPFLSVGTPTEKCVHLSMKSLYFLLKVNVTVAVRPIKDGGPF